MTPEACVCQTAGSDQDMPRSLWNGTIAFGLVRVPVKLYSAIENKDVHFHERHEKDGAAIEHRRLCSKEGKEVPYREVVKGYEVSRGKFVVLTKEEVAAADGAAAHVIDVEHFVCREEIDPVHYDRPYRLGPGKDGGDAYRVLHAALAKADRVGIGRFVFHDRERLVALRPDGDVLALHTMRFDDELVDASDVDIPSGGRAPAARETDMARTLVERLSGPFHPGDYKDEYRKAVLDLIKRKAAGEEIEPPSEPEPEPSDDLLAALQASLEDGGRSRRRSKSSARRSSSRGDGRSKSTRSSRSSSSKSGKRSRSRS